MGSGNQLKDSKAPLKLHQHFIRAPLNAIAVPLGVSVRMEKTVQVVGRDEMVGRNGKSAPIECLCLYTVLKLAVSVGQLCKRVG